MLNHTEAVPQRLSSTPLLSLAKCQELDDVGGHSITCLGEQSFALLRYRRSASPDKSQGKAVDVTGSCTGRWVAQRVARPTRARKKIRQSLSMVPLQEYKDAAGDAAAVSEAVQRSSGWESKGS